MATFIQNAYHYENHSRHLLENTTYKLISTDSSPSSSSALYDKCTVLAYFNSLSQSPSLICFAS